MSFVDEYEKFCRFVLENDVAHRKRPVLYDYENKIYVAHHEHLPDEHFENLNMPPILVNHESYVFVKKIKGFQPEVIKT